MRNHFGYYGWLGGLCAGLVLFVSCSSSGGGPAGVNGGGGGANKGVFLDSAVEGLTYVVGTKDGVTDANGTFNLDARANITFAVGDIQIGVSPALLRVTPIDLVANAFDATDPVVTNIASFLQTLDDDGDPSNGIVITQAVRSAAAGKSINFETDMSSFASDANVLNTVAELTRVTQAGERTLVDIATAQAHLDQTLLASLSGTYIGVVRLAGEGENRPQTGTFTFDVNSTSLDGTLTFNAGGQARLLGVVTSDGSISGTSSDGVQFYGQIELDLSQRKPPGGEWVTWGQYYSGTVMTWSGKPQ